MLRASLLALASVAASLPVAAAIADEPASGTRSHAALPSLRKDRGGPDDEAGAVPTLATVVDVHGGDALPLDDESPTYARFSDLLRDRATGRRAPLDPRLLDLLRGLARATGAPRIELVSGYRSPKLNERLRKKEHHVAKHSQHSLGHAVDFRVEGLTPGETRAAVLRLGWRGGIGRYDGAGDRFVHADVGRARFWNGL